MSPYLVDRYRWDTMSTLEQMGNIYSGVGRSLNAKKSGRVTELDEATVRALDLFDATMESLASKNQYSLRKYCGRKISS
jgi:hypothetical protein